MRSSDHSPPAAAALRRQRRQRRQLALAIALTTALASLPVSVAAPPLAPAVMQFGDVRFGRCDGHGYRFFDHVEDLKLFKVDM